MNVFDITELRKRGLADEALFPDWKILETERRVWELIELICNQFFEKRTFSNSSGDYPALQLDGTGRNILYLPFPIVTLSSISVDGTAQSLSDITVYNRVYPTIDDRRNPKLIHEEGSFDKGNLNIEIEGIFGFVDHNGYPPAPLVDAAMKILMLEMKPLVGNPGWTGGPVQGNIISETADKYTYKKQVGEVISGFTGVPEIDKVLFLYRREELSIRGRVI